MKRTNRVLWTYGFVLALLLTTTACTRHPHGAPPGQVKKVTGETNGKATAPGRQKKKNRNK